MTLELSEALFRIGRLHGENLPAVAIELLEAGYDTSAVRALAGLDKPTLRDAGDLSEQVLRELERPRVGQDEAAWIVARDLAAKVVSGEVSPRDACRMGASFAIETNYHAAFMPFYAADDDYDLPFHTIAQIDQDIMKYCRGVTGSSPHAV